MVCRVESLLILVCLGVSCASASEKTSLDHTRQVKLIALRSLKVNSPIIAVSYHSRNGAESILSWDEERNLTCWNASTGSLIEAKSFPDAAIQFGALSHDGRLLVTARPDDWVRVYDLESSGNSVQFAGHTDISHVALTANRQEIALGLPHGLLVKSIPSGAKTRHFDGLPGIVSATSHSIDGRLIAISCRKSIPIRGGGGLRIQEDADQRIAILDAKTGDLIQSLNETPATGNKVRDIAITALLISPDGTMLVSATDDLALTLWNVGSKKMIQRVEMAHRQKINCLAHSPSGNILVTGSDDGMIKLWAID